MTTPKNLLPRVAAFDHLVRAFGEARRGKRDQPDVQRVEFALEERLWAIQGELEAERYQWGGYRAFWIFDPKRRLIRAAPFRDRVVHHALYRALAPIVERGDITDSYACRVGRGSLAAVRRYEEYVRRQGGRGYVLKADVRLEAGHAQEAIPLAHARQSIASWLGLARHASAFRLSRGLLLEHDVRTSGNGSW